MVKYSRSSGWDSALVHIAETRAYRAGLIAGALTFIAFLGAVKDLYAVLTPTGRGQLVFGFLLLRYTRLERVWFGYRFTGQEALLATIPHLVVYILAAYGLVTRRRWGWYLVFVYVLYFPLSELTFAFVYPVGWLTGHPYNQSIARAEWFFLAGSVALELFIVGLLWRYRDLFWR
ncbi:MAG: hypothetical protein AB7G75_12255 [Candidatus Binatia bacterium]